MPGYLIEFRFSGYAKEAIKELKQSISKNFRYFRHKTYSLMIMFRLNGSKIKPNYVPNPSSSELTKQKFLEKIRAYTSVLMIIFPFSSAKTKVCPIAIFICFLTSSGIVTWYRTVTLLAPSTFAIHQDKQVHQDYTYPSCARWTRLILYVISPFVLWFDSYDFYYDESCSIPYNWYWRWWLVVKFILGILVGFFVIPGIITDPQKAFNITQNVLEKVVEVAGSIGGAI